MTYRKFKRIYCLLILLFLAFGTSCENIQSFIAGDTLAPGSELKGPDGIVLLADKESLDEPVEVELRHSESKLPPLPEPLVEVSPHYEFQAAERRWTTEGAFRIRIPLPSGADPENLVVAFWMSRDHDVWVADQALDDGEADEHWEIVEGYEVSNGYVETTIFGLLEIPTAFVLGEGEWFTRPLESEAAERRQELQGGFEINCEREDYGDCDYETAEAFNWLMVDAYQKFQDAGYPPPLLRTTFGGQPKLYLRGVRTRSLLRPTKLCNYDEEGKMVRGRYNVLTGAAKTCVWTRPQRAPHFEIQSVESLEKFRIEVNGKAYEVTAASTDTPETIAFKLADQFSRSRDKDPATHGISRLVRAIGNRVVFEAWSSNRSDYSISTTSNITKLDYEHRMGLVGTHELFHATQFMMNPGVAVDPFFLEGTAVASQESSLGLAARDPHRSPLSVRVPLFRDNIIADPEDYQSQDFWIFLARKLGKGLEVYQDFAFENDYEGLSDYLSAEDFNLPTLVWEYLRNQFYEGFEPLDASHQACKRFANWDHVDTIEVEDAEISHSQNIAANSAQPFELVFKAQTEAESWAIEPTLGPGGQIAIYRQGPGCSPKTSEFISLEAGETASFWVLLGNVHPTSQISGGFEVKKVRLDAEIQTPLAGAHLPEGYSTFATGRYWIQSTPGEVIWELDGEQLESNPLTEGNGSTGVSFRACPSGPVTLSMEVRDADGNSRRDEVEIQIDETGKRIGINSPQDLGTRDGDILWIPESQLTQSFELTATVSRQACNADTIEPADWLWNVDGETSNGEKVTITAENFESVNGPRPVTAILRHDGERAEIRMRPCGGLSGLPSCPPLEIALPIRDQIQEVHQLFQERDALTAHLALEERLAGILGGTIPEPFPYLWQDIFSGFDQPGQPYLALGQMHTAFEWTDMEDIRREIEYGLSMDTGGHAFTTSVAMVVDATIDYYSATAVGGEDGFYGLSHLVERFTAPKSPAVQAVAMDTYLGTLSAWLEIAPPGADLNDPALLDRALEAGIVQGARRALTESTSGP